MDKLLEVPETKRCTRCGETKPAEAFNRRRNRRGGHALVEKCKSCITALYQERPIYEPIMDGEWTCWECKETKPVTEFPRHKREPNGRHTLCKPCHNAREKVRRHANPERYLSLKRTIGKDGELRKRYGISRDDYLAMLETQGGGCAICGKTPETESQMLAVDHDWKCCNGSKRSCGKCIRGLLCSRCNQGLGHFGDDTALMKKAIAYLKR